jgi:hypothetical protein
MSLLSDLRTYIENNLPSGETTGVYSFQRPSGIDSIVVKPGSSPQANVKMWSQEQFFSIEVIKKVSPQASYNLCLALRDIIVNGKGVLVTGQQRTLGIYAENTAPEVVDTTQEENEVYGITFRVKYIDNTIPV